MGLSIRGNHLRPAGRIRQVDHPGGVLLNDLIPLGVAQHGGDNRQVFLDSCLLNRLSLFVLTGFGRIPAAERPLTSAWDSPLSHL